MLRELGVLERCRRRRRPLLLTGQVPRQLRQPRRKLLHLACLRLFDCSRCALWFPGPLGRPERLKRVFRAVKRVDGLDLDFGGLLVLLSEL